MDIRKTGEQSDMNDETANSDERQSAMSGNSVSEAVASLVDVAIRGIQPRLHETVNQIAVRAADMSEDALRALASKVRRNPLLVIGGVALLIVGLGVAFSLEDRRSRRLAPHELH